MPWYEACALVAAVFICFAFIHSMLVTDVVKSQIQRVLGESFMQAYYRLLYTVISAVTTALTIYLIIIVPDDILIMPPLWMKAVGHSMQFIGVIFGAAAFQNMSPGEFFGLSQASRKLAGQEQQGDEEGLRQYLVTSGVYAMVRHPMYLAGILVFTFNPYITRNWLTVSVMADIYFIVGALIEERRLIARFGDEYRSYMKRVPRLIPRIFLR